MNLPSSHLAAEIDALKELYDAINRNDIDAVVRPLADDIAWIEPAEYTHSATCHGVAAVKAHITRARSHWAEGSCSASGFVPAGDKVVVVIDVHVRLKGETEFREGTHAAVYTFCNGKAVEMRIIDDVQEAFAFAGANASP